MVDGCSRTRALIEEGIASRLHTGAQLYVSLCGKVVADMAVGESRPGVAMQTDTILPWLSAGKPITAVAIAQLWERGLLNLDDRVAEHIPEFGVRGKELITLRHILTHTAGFRAVVGLSRSNSYQDVIAKICNSAIEPRWVPGRTAGYHPASSWYILGEIVRRCDGRPIEQYARAEIFLPLGMSDCWIGIPHDAYRQYGVRIGYLFGTAERKTGDGPPEGDDALAAVVNPGANARGPISQLARFYEAMDGPGHGSTSILRPQTIEAMTARHRVGLFDLTFKHVMDWGLGFVSNSAQYGVETVPYGYGPEAGPRTFGHSGQESSCAFCDPERGLVVAWVCNGMPGQRLAFERHRRINSAIFSDLADLN